jgi:THAP domain
LNKKPIEKMRYRCHVTGCQALSNRNPDEQLSVHQLPVRADTRAKWCEFIGITVGEASDSIRVCSRHFSEDQFKANCYQRRLIPGAIPTILSPTTSASSGSATSACSASTTDSAR